MKQRYSKGNDIILIENNFELYLYDYATSCDLDE